MDSILYWNQVALDANRASHTNGQGEQTGPTLSARALAIVHLAMYDAWAGVFNAGPTLQPLPAYLPGLPVPPANASGAAAVAAAARATLSWLFPSQKPDFDARHLAAGLQGPGLVEGHAFGLVVAERLRDLRRNDPGAGDDGYAASVARGAHRPDPDNPTQGFHAPFYASRSRCFATLQRHHLDAPPTLDSDEYLRALGEVRAKGIAPHLVGTLPTGAAGRTPEDTLIGIYWGYDGAAELGTPPRLYNQIVRKVADARALSTSENARLLALVNVAMADAGIWAWFEKYRYDLWRPVVAIREHDESLGPTASAADDLLTDADPFWLPLGAPNSNSRNKNFTPPFPAYPSGHATFGAAALHMTRLFLGTPAGDRNPDNWFDGLNFVSEELNGATRDNLGTVRPRHARRFSRGLWGMIEENGRSRVYLGVHWVFDAFAVDKKGVPQWSRNVGGVPLGLSIAEDIYASGMQPSTISPGG